MKSILLLFLLIPFVFVPRAALAKDPDNPVEYMNAISSAYMEMNKKYMAYISAAAHSSRKRKIERMRLAALESINTSLYKTNDLPYYKGDNSLRKSSIDYIKLCYNVFNDDYSKIVNMEEIAEQSYDMMQAYILLQQKTDEKISQAFENMKQATKTFATKYNVTITNDKDELGSKLDEAGKLNKFRNNIYLIFFKCNWQDGEITKAMNEGKITVVEQGRTSLIKYANEGLLGLDSLKSFAGDVSLTNCCKRVLTFYKNYSENDLPKQLGFFLKKENFEKMKKSFDSKGSPTKADVDAFNAAVHELNASSNAYNETNTRVNNARNAMVNDWNETSKNFGDAHMPYYK